MCGVSVLPVRAKGLDVVAGVQESLEEGAEVGVRVVTQAVKHVRIVAWQDRLYIARA